MKKSFTTLLLILVSMLLFMEVFYCQPEPLSNAGSEVNHLYGCLLFMTCLLGFSLINAGYTEVLWLRVLASMMCCVIVYEFYPIWAEFVNVIVGRNPSHYMIVRNGRTFKEGQVISMHILLLLAYVPCFDPNSASTRRQTQSLGFLTKPLFIVLPATLVWAANHACVELISMTISDSSLQYIYQMFGLVQCGAFSIIVAWFLRKDAGRSRRQTNQYEIGVLNLLGGVMALGYFILCSGNQNNDTYAFNTVFCILTELFVIMCLGPFRRVALGIPTTSSHIFECLIAAGVASMGGLKMNAGLAMVLGFVLALLVTLYQWIASRFNLKRWQTTGPLILMGAIVGLFTADTIRFSNQYVYALVAFSIAFGAIFGTITGAVLNQLQDYDLEDFGKPRQVI